MNILLLMMGGKGERFGSHMPKQYQEVNGFPLFSYIVHGYSQVSSIHYMVLVCHTDWIDYVQSQLRSYSLAIPWAVVPGGGSRSESVYKGLQKAVDIGSAEDLVLIHDATHPYVDEKGILEGIEAADRFGAATLGGLQFDTMYLNNSEGFVETVLPRQYIVSGASPEIFKLGNLFDIYKNTSQQDLDNMTSAGALALKNHIPMKVIPLNTLNLKITYPDDLELFQKLLGNYFFKS